MPQTAAGSTALVVGAGIGGLAAARALTLAGVDVQILERSAQIKALGAGISLWPNAVAALRRLEAGEVAAAGGVPRGGSGIRAADGRLLAEIDASTIEQRYGAPLVLLHRATLQDGLLRAVGAARIVTGVQVAEVTEREGVLVRSEDGREWSADCLIAADGLRSTVREAILDDGPPRYCGIAAYRGVADWDGDVPAGEYWGAGGVAGLAPIDGSRVYWYLTRREPEDAPPLARDELASRLEGWAPALQTAVKATPANDVLHHGLYDRRPADRWVAGRVALLGDAAHPMLPFLGQGACQALEDAAALRDAFSAGAADSHEALLSYERARLQRANGIVKRSRAAARLTHPRLPGLRRLRDALMAHAPQSAQLRNFDRVLAS